MRKEPKGNVYVPEKMRDEMLAAESSETSRSYS